MLPLPQLPAVSTTSTALQEVLTSLSLKMSIGLNNTDGPEATFLGKQYLSCLQSLLTSAVAVWVEMNRLSQFLAFTGLAEQVQQKVSAVSFHVGLGHVHCGCNKYSTARGACSL